MLFGVVQVTLTEVTGVAKRSPIKTVSLLDDKAISPSLRRGLGAAASNALVEARAIIAPEAREGRILLDQHIDVENAGGGIVHRLSFSDAVEIVWPNK